MTILITGGTGFIGSSVVRRLINENHKIILLKRKESDLWRIKEFVSKLTLYNVSEISLESIFNDHQIDIIIHLAACYVKTEPKIRELAEMNAVNIAFPSELLYLAVKHGVTGLINTGTFSEYRLGESPLSEKTERLPFNYYDATKIAFEEILKYYANHQKIRAVTLKLFSPYGPANRDKVIFLMLNALINGKKLSLTKGEQRLSFTYAEDIVEAYLKAVYYVISPKYRRYESFNIGNEEAYTIREVVAMLKKISGKGGNLKLGGLSYSGIEKMNARCNARKAKQILKWSAKTDLHAGLEETYRSLVKMRYNSL